MTDRYPGYDVLAKRWTQSWNEVTRQVIDRRLAVPREPRFFSAAEWRTLNAVCDRIMPQPKDRPPVPLAAYVDQKIADGHAGWLPLCPVAAAGRGVAAWAGRAGRGGAGRRMAARSTPCPPSNRTGCCAACSTAS